MRRRGDRTRATGTTMGGEPAGLGGAPRRGRPRHRSRGARRASSRAPRPARRRPAPRPRRSRRPSRTRMCRSAKRGDLRQVGHDHDLASEREVREAPSDGDPGLPADAGVHLVEDQSRHVVEVDEHAPAGQHRARELPARRDLRERLRRLSGPPENTNAACSAPPDASSGFGTRVTSIEAPSIPSSPSSRWSAALSSGTARGAAVRDRGGQRRDALGAFGDLGGGALLAPAPRPRARRDSRRARSPNASTSSSPLPYLRRSASSAPIRSRTSCRRAGSSSSRSR